MPERIPVPVVQRRVAELLRVLRERDRVTAHLGDSPHLVGHELRIPDRREGEGDHPSWIGPAPLVDVPVVVPTHHGDSEILVLGTSEVLAAELRKGREVHRRHDAVGVHIADAFVDVEAPRSHLAEARRFRTVLVRRASGDGVEADVGGPLALELPRIGPVVARDHLRRAVLPLGRDVTVEHVRWFDDVIVDRDEDEIFDPHHVPPCSTSAHLMTRSPWCR